MNENAKLWVKALRSGEYKQARNRLRFDEDRFCCLGVACDLYAKATGNGVWDGDKDSGYLFIIGDRRREVVLPYEVVKWLGVSDSECPYGNWDMIGEDRSLTGDNDRGASFEEIADTIDAEPDGLLVESANG